jgi:DNA repair protein RadC
MEYLSNTELLALLIYSGTKDKSAIALAEDVIGCSRGIYHLREMTSEELMSIYGIGKGKAARILAALELGKRVSAKSAASAVNVSSPGDIAALFMEEMRYERKESFRIMLLNAKGDVISIETVSIGELTSTLVHPREVFRHAVKKSAAAVVLVHNHPSGDPTPSQEDLDTTLRLMECGRLMGIQVLDHLVIGDGKYVSIRETGKMNLK